MSELDGEDGIFTEIEQPDPFDGVDGELAVSIKEYMAKTYENTNELVSLMAEGSKISANLPKVPTGIGRTTVTVHRYPQLYIAITRHIQDLQRKRLVIDTFG
jgi:hypothetical protein